MDKFFEYRRATPSQKEVALDCATFLEELGQESIATQIKKNFNLKNIPVLEKEMSPFVQLLESKGISVAKVGEDIREEEILPIVNITAPIDQLDIAFGFIKP